MVNVDKSYGFRAKMPALAKVESFLTNFNQIVL